MLLENGITYKTFDSRDVSHIAKKLLELPEDAWYAVPPSLRKEGSPLTEEQINQMISMLRQKSPCARLFLRWTDEDWISNRYKFLFSKDTSYTPENFSNYVKKFEPNYVDEQLNAFTDTIIKELETRFNGYAGLVVYARLKPGTEIPPHIDEGYYTSIIHRLHIPIITSDNVEFTIANTVFNMKAGTLYEINNQVSHGVANRGNTQRTHLIVDIIPKDKYPS